MLLARRAIRWFANYSHWWMSHDCTSWTIRFTSDHNNSIHDKPYIILFCHPYLINRPGEIYIDRSPFRYHQRQLICFSFCRLVNTSLEYSYDTLVVCVCIRKLTQQRTFYKLLYVFTCECLNIAFSLPGVHDVVNKQFCLIIFFQKHEWKHMHI